MHRPARNTILPLAALLVAASALVGCAPDAPEPRAPSASPTPAANAQTATAGPTPDAGSAVGDAAAALGAQVVAYDAPDGAELAAFSNPVASGAPLVFHVVEQRGEWLRVQLPIRPNGTTGWVRSSDVTLARVDYRVEVSTADRTLTVLRDGAPIASYEAAVGTGDTPTPTGEFYLTELLEPTNGGYGPYAYGISAFSEVLNSFGGGIGQIGIHGTDDESSIGGAVSHGCIRLANEAITELARTLPLGTPVTIT